ncbi:hypothetical protein VB774_15950 [Pseudanabaena galeata UHCC 0370]|uniref:Uncharacterized protein n=1 Tax=Pseudanabaena galeata UHCC 0370 TaxID=3110310 RepID=A0ABU5TLM7_9CYAN|nr:hypothetical protein [Pseudanabaena galeata]MEA5479115.1 hypothetical protein [Pseudanabaena galeata UHCC 0370]
MSDVYSTIAFYLDHQQEVEEYLQQRQQKALEVRKQNELRFDTQGLRDRLLARQAAKHPFSQYPIKNLGKFFANQVFDG